MWKLGAFVLALLVAGMLLAQRGRVGNMGMRIESVTEEKGAITIVTTGAKFILDAAGTLHGWQRIPRERKVLEVRLSQVALPFRIESRDGFACTVSSPSARWTLQGDSVVVLRLNRDDVVSFQGLFRPSYKTEKDGQWLMIDPEGGFGVYPVGARSAPAPDFSKPSWKIPYRFTKGEEVWLSIFPPRPYNQDRARQLIAHEGSEYAPYPSNDVIRSDARCCQIFALHAYFWQDAPEQWKEKTGEDAGKPQPWLTPRHVPSDMREFRRVRDEVHRNGMKFVVYLSPYYSKAPDILLEIRRVLEEYQVDGLFFDGVSNDFRRTYDITRQTRRILGENRILYVHDSLDPGIGETIYWPFIDAYADYILRGEAGRGGLPLNDFLRWIISGYNISNAVGYWVYYGSNRDTVRGNQSSFDSEKTPTSAHIDAALRNEVRIWRRAEDWAEQVEGLARFDREYCGKLKSLRPARRDDR